MGVPRVRQALLGLKPVDRERFGGYARYCLKFQRDDLTTEVFVMQTCKIMEMGVFVVMEKRVGVRRFQARVCNRQNLVLHP